MKDNDFQFLKDLSEAFGPSGCEDAVRSLIIEKIKPFVSSLRIDGLGNLIAEKGNGGNTVISAHMDEVGFMVTGISDDGTLRFSQVGGVSTGFLPSKRVYFAERNCFGVIGAKPIHLNKENGNTPKYDELYIDIGAASKEEAERVISLGDLAVFFTKTEKTDGEKCNIRGKAIDDRLGCFLLCKLIENSSIKNGTFVFTVQEETGLLGATAFAKNHSFDYGIALDVTTPNDLPSIKGPDTVCKIGFGPVISFADGRCNYDQKLISSVFDLLEQNGISCQTKAMRTGGNEAYSFQNEGGGMKSVSISIPCRYIHGPVGQFSEADLLETKKAVICILEKFSKGGCFDDR